MIALPAQGTIQPLLRVGDRGARAKLSIGRPANMAVSACERRAERVYTRYSGGSDGGADFKGCAVRNQSLVRVAPSAVEIEGTLYTHLLFSLRVLMYL